MQSARSAIAYERDFRSFYQTAMLHVPTVPLYPLTFPIVRFSAKVGTLSFSPLSDEEARSPAGPKRCMCSASPCFVSGAVNLNLVRSLAGLGKCSFQTQMREFVEGALCMTSQLCLWPGMRRYNGILVQKGSFPQWWKCWWEPEICWW